MSQLRAVQLAFTRHIRDPHGRALPEDIEDRRMAVYRELFFNNISGFLSNGFPVLCGLYGKGEWHKLCRKFFSTHHCRSPYFVDISKEFVEFLANEYQPSGPDPVFMAELAHYEWVELALSIAQGDSKSPQKATDWQTLPLAVSELAWSLSYQYPVHRISREFQPTSPSGPYYFLVYRDEEDRVQFNQIEQVNAYLINLLEQQPMNLQSLVAHMQQAMPQMDKDQVEKGLREAVAWFVQKGVLYPHTD
ncbi:HvfC family RiPP maturation protein [Bowmanella dokdonensis]|uniref:DNA-binding domain-containing protein n=1 Tax=Bowmanella dokdonensis TaxID=751969 RepID=A0A939DLG3_9ALTE|nr:putative DNA-binding domain-containing protein [Bowmanella dokdonensis]MBN7824914.1 putative DNA-binding domain-containing protein [Bowmanella dokdonensis]